jgi:hypothetical protein
MYVSFLIINLTRLADPVPHVRDEAAFIRMLGLGGSRRCVKPGPSPRFERFNDTKVVVLKAAGGHTGIQSDIAIVLMGS